MPAIRTAKSGRQSGDEPFQLTWTAPVEPESHQTISFAPNVTPVTYTAPPPSDEDAILSKSTLFPEAVALYSPSPDSETTASTTSRKRRKGAKGDADGNGPVHIPRPPNAFILFRSSFIKSQHVSSKIEGNHGTLSKIVGMLWHSLPHEERQVWQAKARKALAEHKKKYPEYSFRPSAKDKDKGGTGNGDRGGGGGGGDGIDDNASVTSSSTRDSSTPPASAPPKRKHREVGPRDVARCEQIAHLLRKGTKGRELEEAMRAFDASRAPAVITPRFEEPITAEEFQSGAVGGNASATTRDRDVKVKVEQAESKSLRHFRRGSSAPLLDVEQTENARKQASFMQTRPPSPVTQQTQTVNMETQPSFRAHRKRSASSSPPIRSRPLLPHSSLPSIGNAASYANFHAAAAAISLPPLNTALQYQPTQPMSAPALSRQTTEYSLDGGETTSGGSFFEYDGSQATSLYDDMSPSPPSEYEFAQSQGMQMWASSEANYEFNNFSFASPTSPVDSSPSAVSPFEHTPQVQHQQHPTEHQLNLLLQTYSPSATHHDHGHAQQASTWSTTEYNFEHLPSSPTDSVDNASSPVNATSFEYEYAPSEYDNSAPSFASSATSSGAQTPTAFDFYSTPSGLVAPAPASPTATSSSDGNTSSGTHTQLATPDNASCFGTMQLPVGVGYATQQSYYGAEGKMPVGHLEMGLGLHVDEMENGYGGYMGGVAVSGM